MCALVAFDTSVQHPYPSFRGFSGHARVDDLPVAAYMMHLAVSLGHVDGLVD